MLVLDAEDKVLTLNRNGKSVSENVSDFQTPDMDSYNWILDLQEKEYRLTRFVFLEEITSPTVVLSINGFSFPLPANWNILIIDNDTQQLDVVELKDVAGKEFLAFVFGPHKARHESAVISVIDYFPSYHNVGPFLSKHQMLCHPIARDAWVNVSPSDGYNKYLKDTVAGDII